MARFFRLLCHDSVIAKMTKVTLLFSGYGFVPLQYIGKVAELLLIEVLFRVLITIFWLTKPLNSTVA